MIGSIAFAALRQEKARSALATVAIALGVALGFAVQLINHSAVGEFARATRTIAGTADVTIRGARDGFEDALYPVLANLGGVTLASPALEVEAKVPGRDEALRVVGVDIFRVGRLQPALYARGADLFDALRGDAVFLSPAAMRWLATAPGASIAVQTGLTRRSLRVAGEVQGELAAGRLAIMDIGAAQEIFERLGRLTRIDLRLATGLDPERFIAALDLPPGVAAELPRDAEATTGRMTRAYRVNLDVLALVALFTGGLLVASTQALSVARRRRQIALLRVLGHTRRQIVALVLVEGAVLGIAGAVLGLTAGVAIALLALEVMGADLGAGYFRNVAPVLSVSPVAAISFGALGILAALAGSVAPALDAARAAPAAALKSGDEQRAFAALAPLWPGLLLLLIGGSAVWLPPVSGLPVFGYLAIAALLVGTILLLPALTSGLVARLPRPGPLPLALALARLQAQPAQAALSLAAIVAAVGLMVSMAIMVDSFRTSLDEWLIGVLPADLYVRSGGASDTAYFTPQDQDRLRSIPGIARIEFLRSLQILIRPGIPRITLLARDGVDADAERRLPLVSGVAPVEGTRARVWVSEPASAVLDVTAGSRLSIPLNETTHDFVVGGVWRDYARQNGAVLIDRDVYGALTADRNANDAGIWLAPGAAPAAVRQAVVAIVGEEAVEFATPGEIRTLSLAIFDRTFAVTYALEAAALMIGLVGLSSTFAAQVHARRLEFGMLRHIGTTRLQVAQMLALEGLALGTVGLAVGAALGFAMSLILVHVVNRQSFHWGMQLHIPWLGLSAFAALLLLLGALSAVLAGRQAMTGYAVRAVKEDW